MSFLSKIEGFFKHAGVVVSDIFAKVFGHDVAVAFGHSALSLLQTAEGKIAVSVVEGLAALPGSNAEKRQQAIDAIGSQAKAAGLEVKDSLVSLLVELAVGFVKGHFTPSQPAA